MKRIIILTALAAAFLTACNQELNIEGNQPEAQSVVFTATTESPDTKTALSQNADGYDVVWNSGDMITIIDSYANVGVYSTSSTSTLAEFTKDSGADAAASPYKAWYPASIYNEGAPSLPGTQDYIAGNISGSPMYAESSNNSLAFKNICGIIRLNISTTQTGKKVRRIVLGADQGMSGAISNAATLVADNYVAAVSGSDCVTLDCGEEGVAIGTEPTAFYLAVPENSYTGLSISVETTDGLSQTRTAKDGIVVGRSSITTISLGVNDFMLVVDLASTTETVTIPSGVNARLIGSKTNRTVVVEGGGSVITLEDASIYMLNLNGDATVVSKGSNSIYNGDDQIPLFIKEGSAVTFRGEGSLNVTAYYCTGALVCENNNADVIIESGTYTFTVGVGSTRAISAGNLSISGGEVNAISTDNYAGIYAEKTVTISGGTVVARGDALGIYVNGGDMIISGGTVTAEQTRASTFWGGPEATVAGICVHSNDGLTGGTLTISGGTVNAIGHIGPGIGASWHRSGWSLPAWTRSIVFSGGTITSSTEQSGFGAIHFNGFGNPARCDAITITEGITSLTLIQGATAAFMFASGDVKAALTIDGLDMTGYLTDPSTVDWTSLPNLQRTVSTTVAENDTWTFAPKL